MVPAKGVGGGEEERRETLRGGTAHFWALGLFHKPIGLFLGLMKLFTLLM